MTNSPRRRRGLANSPGWGTIIISVGGETGFRPHLLGDPCAWASGTAYHIDGTFSITMHRSWISR